MYRTQRPGNAAGRVSAAGGAAATGGLGGVGAPATDAGAGAAAGAAAGPAAPPAARRAAGGAALSVLPHAPPQPGRRLPGRAGARRAGGAGAAALLHAGPEHVQAVLVVSLGAELPGGDAHVPAAYSRRTRAGGGQPLQVTSHRGAGAQGTASAAGQVPAAGGRGRGGAEHLGAANCKSTLEQRSGNENASKTGAGRSEQTSTQVVAGDEDHGARLCCQVHAACHEDAHGSRPTEGRGVLYVPEKCMEDEDAAVRLMTMQAWAELVDIFHESKDWLFKKAVVNLLVWPINECLKQERLLNVTDAAFTSWQKIVCVAVQDFNEFCNSNDTTAQCLPAWRKWLGELVILPVLTVMRKRDVSVGKPSTIELERFVKFVKKVWEPAGHEYGNSKEKAIPARNESSSSTTMGGSSTDGSVGTKKHVHAQNSMSRLQVDSVALLKILNELSLTREPNCRPITSKLVGLAFLLEDVSSAVQNLIEASDDIREEHNKRLGNELVMTIWKGFCQRIHSSDAQNDALSSNVSKASKLKLRAMRMSIDFAFGILVLRSNEACAPVSTEVLTLLDQAGQKPEVVVASVGFGLEWQLKLLAPLVSGVTHAGDLQVVMLHSKSKLFEHIARRMDYLKDMYTQCTTVMQKWEDSEAGELLVDFSSKTNVLPYVLLNLLFEYAVFVDDTNNNYGCGQQATLLNLDIVVKKLVESAKSSGQQKSRGVSTLLRFSEDAIQAAHYLFDDEAGGSEKISMLNTLTTIFNSSSEHSYESQQNASLLLDLHQSKGNPIASSAITASSAEFSATSNTNEKTAVHGSDFVSASLDTSTSLPCLLSGEILAISNVSSDPMSKDARSTKKGSGLNCSPDADAVNNKFDGSPSTLTPRKADISEQNKTAKIQPQPAGSQSAPPKLVSTQSGGHSKRLNLDTAQCIYPDLVGCAESIASLYRHFPMGFRPFFSFYKVKTIGDLSALPMERVRTFGLKEPVSTVRRALEEYNGRKDRMKSLTGSPFRQRSGSMSTSPAIPTPPSHKPSKRPFILESGGTALLPLEKRQHKRTKRSLLLDEDGGDDGEEESEGTRRKPKLADRVTFCLQSGDAGETRITRPGEDSQDQLKPSEKANEKESVQEKMDTYTLKLLQHLRRSTHYMDKLVTEEESLQSQEESLQASIATVGGVITNYQEAHNLILRLTAQLQSLVPWSGLEIERQEIALDENREGVLVSTPHWRVRKGTYSGASVAIYSCRSTPLKQELWIAALGTLQQFVAPFPHPNIVQFLGVVAPPEQLQSEFPPPHECIVMEYLPISLYDVLHHDQVALSRREISLIAIQVLRGLLFLHRKNHSLGSCLTSKKVMLDGANRVKLRRFGLEMVLRSGVAPSQRSSPALQTVYEMAPDPRQISKSSVECSSASPPRFSSVASDCISQRGTPAAQPTTTVRDSNFTSISQDLFAFGVLLLEMCTGKKPTNELFNRISCAKQIDPVFYDILKHTLSLNGTIAADNPREKSYQVSTEELLTILVVNEQQRVTEELDLSSSSFPSFIHADRYIATKEANQVDLKLRERERREEIDLKRLAAVEQELLDEQRNFAVLVLQLEQAQKEKALEMAEKQQLQIQLLAQEETKFQCDEQIKRLVAKVHNQAAEVLSLQDCVDKERERVASLQLAKLSDAEEKQGLLFEILKLKEEKRKLTTEKQDIETECASIARKVGSERETLEDLEGRLAQAIHRWEEEKRMRRKAERQVEATGRQLLQMEEERCSYSSALQHSPTRKLAPKESLSYVLALKDKEIDELSRQLQEAIEGQALLQDNNARFEAEWKSLSSEKEDLLAQLAGAHSEMLSLTSQIGTHDGVITGLQKQLEAANTEIKALKSRIVDFEEELARIASKKVEEGRANMKLFREKCSRSGSALSIRDPKTARHRRHRSWDDASIGGIGIRKNAMNIPVMKIVHVLTTGDDTRVKDTDQQQLLEAVKQLTLLLKSDHSLKDDLPECLVIKSLLTLMHQHKGSLVLQLECCRCLSVVVFNHDRNRLIVVAEGGVDPVVAAMKNFQLEAKLQEVGCVLLTNLAHNCGKFTPVMYVVDCFGGHG
ncbi:unnamed protein product [Phytophthora lilii]|uniref:Unnamed protein product n=1 Tax=Phytophthora lilii TaxID=2077276 RepID=A0A9W6WQW9_9STRA|nr:unnamed protein product [Phytophthora lilii]